MMTRNITLDGKQYVLIPVKYWKRMTREADADRAKPIKGPAPLPGGRYGLEHVRISLPTRCLLGVGRPSSLRLSSPGWQRCESSPSAVWETAGTCPAYGPSTKWIAP